MVGQITSALVGFAPECRHSTSDCGVTTVGRVASVVIRARTAVFASITSTGSTRVFAQAVSEIRFLPFLYKVTYIFISSPFVASGVTLAELVTSAPLAASVLYSGALPLVVAKTPLGVTSADASLKVTPVVFQPASP